MEELQRIYDSEINVSISWFCDGGIEVKLGDEMNGYAAETTLDTFRKLVPWLQEQITKHFPYSTYTKNLIDNRLREYGISPEKIK